jgi:hypothetical protein
LGLKVETSNKGCSGMDGGNSIFVRDSPASHKEAPRDSFNK